MGEKEKARAIRLLGFTLSDCFSGKPLERPLDGTPAQAQHCYELPRVSASQFGVMLQTTPCERCQRVGVVRLERIITGSQVTLSYYCGACDHSWKAVIPDPRQSVQVTEVKQKDRRRSV
jgi:hypothetical protein